MKTFWKFLGILPVLLILWQCSGEPAAEIQTGEKVFPVKLEPLSPRAFTVYLDITGTVKARNHIKILVEEGGTVDRILIDKGNYARKGDTLIVLRNQILEAGYKEAAAALKQAELNYRSQEILYQKKAISENEFLTARYSLERAQAAYNLARSRMDKLFIRAPLNGFVNDRYYDLGAYAMPLSPILDFIDNAQMKIIAGVAERYLGDVQPGNPVEITFDAFPELKIQSKVSFVAKSVDPLSRTFNIEIVIPNPGNRLAPEMIANVRLQLHHYENEIVVPLDAIVENELGRFVFVEKEQRAHRLPVELITISGDSALVKGLQPGDRLVVLGQHDLTEGDRIAEAQSPTEEVL